jgi:hypothetical protein
MSIVVGLALAVATTFTIEPDATPVHICSMEFKVAVILNEKEPPAVKPPAPATMVTELPVAVAPPPEKAALAVLVAKDQT